MPARGGFLPLLNIGALSLLSANLCSAAPSEICLYRSSDGKIIQVNSREEVPAPYRDQAQCLKAKARSDNLAAPSDISLKGLVREENMVSALGPIRLRWPRTSEVLFGRTPQRATAEAASAVSRALKQGAFPPKLQNLRLEWNIVFMGGEIPVTQIPAYLVTSCHPGWMTPPSNIYIVSDRVANGCGGSGTPQRVADAQLAEVLIHEMGHAVEYALLANGGDFDQMRAEGFATWFEGYASEFSVVIPHGQAEKAQLYTAKGEAGANGSSGFEFSGTAGDYAYASMFFKAIEERRGIRGIVDVYDTIRTEGLSFFPAVQRRLGWDQRRYQGEVQRLLGK
jgi:hypothetical protein